MKKFFFLLSLIFIDQLSKYQVIQNLSLSESLNLLPILDIYLILNTGVAFSLFDDGGSFGIKFCPKSFVQTRIRRQYGDTVVKSYLCLHKLSPMQPPSHGRARVFVRAAEQQHGRREDE